MNVLSTKEAARRTGYAARTLRQMIAAGTLPAALVGGSYVVAEGDLALVPPYRPRGRPRVKKPGGNEPPGPP